MNILKGDSKLCPKNVQLNEEIIKGQIKESARGSVEKTLNELPEESSFFLSVGKPFPAVSIRTSTERPDALDAECFVLAGIGVESLLQAVEMTVTMQRTECFGTPVAGYTAENVSMKVARIIQSYTGIVNKMVWRKDE